MGAVGDTIRILQIGKLVDMLHELTAESTCGASGAREPTTTGRQDETEKQSSHPIDRHKRKADRRRTNLGTQVAALINPFSTSVPFGDKTLKLYESEYQYLVPGMYYL